MVFRAKRNYIISYEDIRNGLQFQVVNLPENSAFLYDRKRIECFSDYKSVLAAKFMAEEEFKTNRGRYDGLDELEALYGILERHDFIKVEITGQKRRSIDSYSESEVKEKRVGKPRIVPPKPPRYHYHEDSEEYYRELAKKDSA